MKDDATIITTLVIIVKAPVTDTSVCLTSVPLSLMQYGVSEAPFWILYISIHYI